ncbi:hypothetical protein CBF93_04145 [Limosilactobacillus reuteri]|uniref:hypothetical protein n=1 Tax=Limosilactobacillus reuteri TaxID=1598 RepID=UPI000B999F91|nr:hypothetical protein [Limosilactobacillus reuteri]OYS53876.1 hypothetical protein CBF92_05345 [Limosilactobacillus reuteri]OYS55875.1 hypothetical protein CBF95_05565 [Limosilactobacillus reuteri]OYS61335.1 hypothetical protein CBF93_04145 [Limosilactobacillus reuteri]
MDNNNMENSIGAEIARLHSMMNHGPLDDLPPLDDPPAVPDPKLTDEANKATLDSLEVLKKIEMNTAYLRDIVDLLSVNNEHQKELNDLVQSILAIAKAPDKDEAQSRYRRVMKKIGDFSAITSATLNVVKLSSLATTVLQFFMQSH